MAYGARLESELGASPQGFKSPILRANEKHSVTGVFFICIDSEDLRVDTFLEHLHRKNEQLLNLAKIKIAIKLFIT